LTIGFLYIPGSSRAAGSVKSIYTQKVLETETHKEPFFDKDVKLYILKLSNNGIIWVHF
jgi:hypothetical protein